MDDQTKLTLAAAVAGGYVLGRTRKGRLALTAATFVAGRSLEPRQLLLEGLRRLRETPQLAELGEQLRGEVFQAGRAAVKAAAGRRFGSLAGSLRDRSPGSGDEDGRDDDEEERDEEEPEEEEQEPEEEEEPREPARGAGRRQAGSGKGAEARKKAPAKKAKAPAKKTAAPAKKAAAKKTAADKTASRTNRSGRSTRSDRGR